MNDWREFWIVVAQYGKLNQDTLQQLLDNSRIPTINKVIGSPREDISGFFLSRSLEILFPPSEPRS